MATNVTLPDEQALRMVNRYCKEHHKPLLAVPEEPRPPRKPIIRPPHFEPGTKPEEKVAMLLAAGFVQVGTTPGGNPLFRHPENPEGYAPFELFTKKRSFERAPAERPRRSAQEMVSTLATKKQEAVRVREDGTIVPADGKHTHKHRKVHGRPRLTPEQLDLRKAILEKAKAAEAAKLKAKKEDEKSSENGKGKGKGKNKNGTQKKK